MRRSVAALVIASLLWIPSAVQTANAIPCYRGAPPAVYQACLAYNQGIALQVANERQLQAIRSQIRNAQAQIDALYALIKRITDTIANQQALIALMQSSIDD